MSAPVESLRCCGVCASEPPTCEGPVRRVEVSDSGGTWGAFSYCQRAIDVDRGNRFVVTVEGEAEVES